MPTVCVLLCMFLVTRSIFRTVCSIEEWRNGADTNRHNPMIIGHHYWRTRKSNITHPNKRMYNVHTANAMYGKFEITIPRNETSRPRSQFPHSCICERFIYSYDRSTNAIQQNRRTDRGNLHINRSHIHEWKNWEWGCAFSFL